MNFPKADELASIALDKCEDTVEYHLNKIKPVLVKAANNGRFGEIHCVSKIRVANAIRKRLIDKGYGVTVVERVDNLGDIFYDLYIDWSHKDM